METPTTQPFAPQAQELFAPTLGFALFQICGTTVSLGVCDALEDDPRTADDLAAELHVHAGSLFRLLRAAAAVGMVTMVDEDKFRLSELGRMFRRDSPSRVRDTLALNSAAAVWQAWGALGDAVRTGRPAFDEVHGVGVFSYLERDRALAEVFHRAMASGTESQLPLLIPHYDLAGCRSVVDVGGGNGTHLSAVLAAHEQLAGTVLDTVGALRDAPAVIAAAGVADRCRLMAGDFFAEVPPGADVYIVKNTLTDWDDDACVRILRNCREAMPLTGRILVVASVMPAWVDGAQGSGRAALLAASIFDVSLMTLTPGRERTLAEYEKLFRAAGLRLGTVRPVPGDDERQGMLYHVIEALRTER